MSKVSSPYSSKTEADVKADSRKSRKNVPPLSSLPGRAKRGHLWKLSGRSLLSKSNWKRKYFVLWEGRLFYYQNEEGGGEERGSGVLHLKYFNSCVEAPLTDHKKATNVFILLASERGFLDQGRCYLSAETLGEMKDWVSHLKAAIEKIHKTRVSVPDMQEEQLEKKSSSLTSLPSHHSEKTETPRTSVAANNRLNKSMDERSAAAAFEQDQTSLDRTYAYSSSEESLNQLSLPLTLRNSGSVYTSLQRRSIREPAAAAAARRQSSQFNSLPKQNQDPLSPSKKHTDQFNSLPKNKVSEVDKAITPERNTSVRESPCQSVHSSRKQLKFQDTDSRICSRDGSLTNLSVSTLQTSPLAQSENGNVETEDRIRNLEEQLEQLKRLYHHMDSETTSNRRDVGSLHESLATINTTARGIEERMARFQAYMTGVERQAGTLILEIRATQDRVLRTLEEAERSKREYNNLRQKAELLILQIQGDAVALNLPSQQLSQPTLFNFGSNNTTTTHQQHQQQPVVGGGLSTSQSQHQFSLPTSQQQQQQFNRYMTASQTFPKLKNAGGVSPPPSSRQSGAGSSNTPSPITRGKSGRSSVHFCQDPTHSEESIYQKPAGPIYSTPIKSHKDLA